MLKFTNSKSNNPNQWRLDAIMQIVEVWKEGHQMSKESVCQLIQILANELFEISIFNGQSFDLITLDTPHSQEFENWIQKYTNISNVNHDYDHEQAY